MSGDRVFEGGILLLEKPIGPTSHDMVGKVRRLYGTRQVGHTGTLDPLASGLLVVLVGRAVKASDLVVAEDKRYIAGLRLGMRSDTQDVTGRIEPSGTPLPDPQDVSRVCQTMRGAQMQLPPMYSAIKVGGKKLYELARNGQEIEREARPIEVFDLCAEPCSASDYTLSVHCSKGTYIRTLCADIGERLGCGGLMTSLCRTSCGPFSVANAYRIEQLETMTAEERDAALIPVEHLFDSLPVLTLSAFFERLARNGCEIYQDKIRTAYAVGTRVRLYGAGGFFALGEIREYPDGSAVKVIKLFQLEQ